RGERFGLVGESGCGKSTTAMALLRLLQPPGRIESGEIWLNGTDLARLNRDELRRVRWSQISFIPQGAMNSLNPVMRVRDQIADVITVHEGRQSAAELERRIEELLAAVGLPRWAVKMYPHELSGGMKQRVCIAMAIALSPRLIVADEPTSALDVVVQRVVTQTLVDVQERLGASLILIGHDMGLQAQLVHRLAVMYAGRIAEIADAETIFENPAHPYSRLLISSVPSTEEKKTLQAIPGLPPALLNPPPGCIFHPRCPAVMERCRTEVPAVQEIGPEHQVACHLYGSSSL
ncbi:MAG: ABC transporter ATP-binding protein, partial [Anaerolineae bacterium]|nr:ABC transporter ATP-binding protein [Anaerolineae bacterium]